MSAVSPDESQERLPGSRFRLKANIGTQLVDLPALTDARQSDGAEASYPPRARFALAKARRVDPLHVNTEKTDE
ncbi:MAG: hypothetical protein V1685_05640 [Parcubacteria group bacterium]